MNDLQIVTKIVEERTRRIALHLPDKPHEEHAACRTSCCWGSPIRVDGYEIAIAQPSARHKGEELYAFFTFKKL